MLHDQNAPKRLIGSLRSFEIVSARRIGWSELSNGDVLAARKHAGFDVLLTADRNLRHQQNMAGRTLGIVVLPTNRWTIVLKHLHAVETTLLEAMPGTIADVTFT